MMVWSVNIRKHFNIKTNNELAHGINNVYLTFLDEKTFAKFLLQSRIDSRYDINFARN